MRPAGERYHTHLLWSEIDGERRLIGAAAVSSGAQRPVSSAFLDAIAAVLIAPDGDAREL